MTIHMIWGLIGFNLALLFVWVFHMLRTRGFQFFWTHPIIAAAIVILTLYILEGFFSSMAAIEVQLDWNLTLWIGVPLAILVMVFFYRAITMKKQNTSKALQ